MSQTALLEKLHKVAKAIKYIEKRGHNDHHHYNFVQAVDVTRVIRDELLKRKVVVIPSAGNVRHLAYGSKGGHLTSVDLYYRFIDIETGSEVPVSWVGVGADTGGDKGVYKAFTGGLKYALLSLFLIPMTQDPEKDQLTGESESEPHKDDARPPATRIPVDRAQAILQKATDVGMAETIGGVPVFHPAFKAALALQGVDKIGALDVDQAEAIELFLAGEEAGE